MWVVYVCVKQLPSTSGRRPRGAGPLLLGLRPRSYWVAFAKQRIKLLVQCIKDAFASQGLWPLFNPKEAWPKGTANKECLFHVCDVQSIQNIEHIFKWFEEDNQVKSSRIAIETKTRKSCKMDSKWT